MAETINDSIDLNKQDNSNATIKTTSNETNQARQASSRSEIRIAIKPPKYVRVHNKNENEKQLIKNNYDDDDRVTSF